MRLFGSCYSQEAKIKILLRKDFMSVPEADHSDIYDMYKLSLFQSYLDLWRTDPGCFAHDILKNGATAEEAIQVYSERIARLTIKEWQDENLKSIIIYESKGSEQKIVGFALFGKDLESKLTANAASYYLYYIGVASTHFQQGIGTQLMSSMLKHCEDCSGRDNNAFNIKLHTRVFNKPAIKLYEKFGLHVLPEDYSHGHSNKYLCYFQQFSPEFKNDFSVYRSKLSCKMI